MPSTRSQRKTWSCNPTSPTATISSQGADIRRRTAGFVRTTGSYLSVRRTSERNTRLASSIGNSPRTSISHLNVFQREEQSIGDINNDLVDGHKNTLIHDLGEEIEIVKDRGDSFREVRRQRDSDVPETKNNDREGLKSILFNARVKSADGRHFIPTATVERLLTEERVKEELEQSLPEASSQELDELSRKICSQPGSGGASNSTRCLRLFATLVLVDRPANIRDFIRSGISDRDLPISGKQLQQARDDNTSSEKLPLALSDWTPDLQERFVSQQWELFVPFFSNSNTASKVRFYELDPNTILPFTVDESNDSTNAAGGFSEVYKVQIHTAHHDFSKEIASRGRYAVKRLRHGNEGHFAEELKALQTLTVRSQPHLITPLATFKHGENYSFIFPWANGGNLRQFWKANQPPRQLDSDAIHWIQEQCLGLAQGLVEIHKVTREESEIRRASKSETVFGRHGDLKPENILWFKPDGVSNDRGTLKISDFGLTRFHRSADGQHREQRHTPTYRAPEYDLNRGISTQAYDIWSLGCVFLEFITWYLHGIHGVDDVFTEVRTMNGPKDLSDDSYFIVKRDEVSSVMKAEVKPSVTQWIDDLRKSPKCTPYLRRMLDIIETRMLVVDVEKRIEATECVSALTKAASHIDIDDADEIRSAGQSTLTSESAYGSSEEPRSIVCRPVNQLPQRNHVSNMRLELLDATSHRTSAFDQLRLQFERKVGHRFDWSPLPPVNRRPASAAARLVWNYGGHDIPIFLNGDQLEHYRHRVRVTNPGILPTTNAPQSFPPAASTNVPGLTTRWQYFRHNALKVLQYWQRNGAAKCHTVATNPSSNITASVGKESYFCIDKHRTSVKQTSMYTVPSVDLLENDYQLFVTLRDSLKAARGSWLYRLSSLRTCTGVKLSKFTFLFDNCDLVKAFEKEANRKTPEICKGYEYYCLPDTEPDEHMQLMAESILQGLQEPEQGRNSRAVLDGIPKLQAPPGIHKRQFNSGWGFYTTQEYCLMKILLWVGMVLSPGVAFVIAWLSSVNHLDLQNAFVPIQVLSGVVAIVLAIVLMCPT